MLKKDRIKEFKRIKNAEPNEKIVESYEYLLFLSDFLPGYKEETIGEKLAGMTDSKSTKIIFESFEDSSTGAKRWNEADIIAAYYYKIVHKKISCNSTISYTQGGVTKTKKIIDALKNLYTVSAGSYGLIKSFCEKPNCWTVNIVKKERYLLTNKYKKVADFKYTCPEKSYWDNFKKTVGATTNAALIFMTDLWHKATGFASAAFTSLEDAFNSFEMEGIDISSGLPSFDLGSSTQCQGWQPFIQRYGQKGTELMKAFEEYNSEDSCYEFLSCHYKNFLDWYDDKKQDLGRPLTINESIQLLKEESSDCKSKSVQAPITDIEDMGFSRSEDDGYDLDYLLGKNQKFKERYDRSYDKTDCRKDWSQNEVEEYIIELIDGRMPIHYIDEKGNKSRVLSGTRTSRLAKRYVRRYFGSLSSIDKNLEDVAKSVMIRLTSEVADKYSNVKYCKSGEHKEDRSKVFFALQDSFKAGSAQDTEDFSYRDTRKTKRQLRRAK